MFDARKDSSPAPQSFKDAIKSFTRAALLALPLAGCSSSITRLPEHEERLESVASSWGPLTHPTLHPPAGNVLTGISYTDGVVKPRFEAAENARNPFSPTEMRLLHSILAEEPGIRYVSLRDLELDYCPRLEPALLHLVLDELDPVIADRAARLLMVHGENPTIDFLCEKILTTSGADLGRCLDILKTHSSDRVAEAMFRAIRTSGYGEKEARDEEMRIGKTLAGLNPCGEKLAASLLADEDPSMQMAGAVSLAAHKREAALPILLRYAVSDDFILRSDALGALAAFPGSPAVLPPLERALSEPAMCQIALAALREIGEPALPILAPYANVERFKSSGIERTGQNPYLPGLAYGEIVEAICRCEAKPTAPPLVSNPSVRDVRITILGGGIGKLLDDLETPQLRPGAHEGFLALGSDAHPFLPLLIGRSSARQLLLTYPPHIILNECSPFLISDGISPMTLETCQVLAQTIRLVPSPTLRQDAVREVLSEHPDAPWLRHFVGQLWREDCDEMWTRAAIDAAPFGSAVCAIKDEIDAAREFGIDIPLRWSRENLTEIVRNRALLDFDGRPIAAIVYAEADYNGAFGEHNAMVEALIQNGYCVMYFDESTDTGVLRALRTATTRPSSPKSEPAALIVLGAHSSKTDMVFGRKGEGENRLSVEDKDIIVESLVKDTLRENGQIVLIACSAGEGREKEDNVANLFRGVFSHAKAQGIWSTEVPDNIGSWKFDPATHELTDVRFLRGKVYRP